MTVLLRVKRSSDSRTAIRLAAQEALYRDTILIAVMAYPPNAAGLPPSSQYVLCNAPCPVLTVPQ